MPHPPAPIELVVFDCDGVLVDSERIAVRIDLVVLERVGLPMTQDDVVDRFVGRSPSVMRDVIEEHLGGPLSPALEAEFAGLYRDAFAAELVAVDGIHEALAEIATPTCVASSSEPASLHRKLRQVGLLDHFDGRIFSAAEVRRGKPAPDLFLHAAARMGVDPSRCVVVEDSQYGAEAGRAAGMSVFAYLTEFASPDRLRGERTRLFSDMRALPGLLCAHGAHG